MIEKRGFQRCLLLRMIDRETTSSVVLSAARRTLAAGLELQKRSHRMARGASRVKFGKLQKRTHCEGAMDRLPRDSEVEKQTHLM